MAYWLDSEQYRPLRRFNMDFALLGRAYFEGNPYEVTSGTGAGLVRINILEPMSEYSKDATSGQYEYIGPGHDYEYNLAKLRIERMVAEILPEDASLVVSGFEDDEEQTKLHEFLAIIANLGSKYRPTPSGIIHWMRQNILDAAQTGDRLGFPKYLAPDEVRGLPARVRLGTFDYSTWDAELDGDDESDVIFYRIEQKKYGNDDKAYWHRYDIFDDHIIRYSPQPAVGDPPGHLLYPGVQDWTKLQPHYFPGVMNAQVQTTKEKFEAELLKKLGGHMAVPIRYDDRALQSYRGTGEIQVHDMRTIDRANKHLVAWSNATEETNFPTLIFWDAIFPKAPDGSEMTAPNFRTGSQWKLTSMADKPGRVGYPENIPTQFAYGDYLQQCLTVAFGHVPFMGRKPEDMRAFAEMTGFAHGVMTKMMDDRVSQIRQRAVEEGFLELLRNATRLAAARDILPNGIDAEKIKFDMIYGRKPMTADEALKQVLACESGLKMGVPVTTIVPHLPFSIKNEQEVVQGIEEAKENALELTEAIGKARADTEAQGAVDAAGVDKKTRPKSAKSR